MEMICPQCGVKGTIKDSFVGKRVRCPKCEEIFRVPLHDEHSEDLFDFVEQDLDSGQMISPDTVSGVDEITREIETLPGSWTGDENLQETVLSEREEEKTLADTADDIDEKLSAEEKSSRPSLISEVVKDENTQSFAGITFSLQSFTVFGVIKEAWKYVKGVKLTFFLAMLMIVLFSIAVNLVSFFLLPKVTQLIAGMDTANAGIVQFWVQGAVQFFISFLSSVFGAGLIYMGVRRVAGYPVSPGMVFSGFSKILSLFLAFFLMTLMILSGFVLFVLPGIYLSVGYMLTLPLIIDRDMSVWQAMETSRMAIHKVWWKVFAIFLVVMQIMWLSVIPFGLGLIWTMPMYVLVFGVIYRALFDSDMVQ